MRALVFGAILAAVSGIAGAQRESAAAPTPLLLAHAHVLDEAGNGWRDDVDVYVASGRIQLIARGEKPADDATRIDASGLFVVPGLIDLHSHLCLHPYDETPWDDQVLKESLELRTIRAVAAARVTLEAGFTTLRDLGTEGAGFADVALRDAVAKGIVPGPRIFATTRAIVATGCYGPADFDPRFRLPKGAQEASGVDGVRRAVREQIAARADWIKLYADYRRRPGDPATPTFTQEELGAAVDEARAAGLLVAAHATTDEGIRRAVLAGVATIEHGDGASDETLALLAAKGCVLCPTLAASEAMARYGGWRAGMPDDPRVRASRDTFARARKAGVVIACGSDVGVFAHGDEARELELMVAYGMTPAEALRAATSTAARVLRRDRELGRIAPGYVADLVAFPNDPLKEITATRRPALVVKEGRVALRNAVR